MPADTFMLTYSMLIGKGRITCQSQEFLEVNSGFRYLEFGVPIDSNGCILGNSTIDELARKVSWYDSVCKTSHTDLEVFNANGASWIMIHFIDMVCGSAVL